MASGKKRDTKHKRRQGGGGGEGVGVKKKTTFKTKNPKTQIPLGDNRGKKKKQKQKQTSNKAKKQQALTTTAVLPPSEQLSYFLNQFESANGLKLSPLELEAFKDTCVLELSQDLDQDAGSLGTHLKAAFGKSWREVLYKGGQEEAVDPGSPAVLVISTSALRALELLRGVRVLTKECHAAKLFAKHMKVEEQVEMLKSRVNIASGTPSRIKKLIDMEALRLSRLSVIVMDMHTDAKGYSLFTLPQVRDEFWDLYKIYFQQRIIQGDLKICLYGPVLRAIETNNEAAPEA